MNIYNKYHNIRRIIILALHKVKFLSKENPSKALKVLNTIKINDLSNDIDSFYYYIKADTLFHLRNYKEATLNLKNIPESSGYYLRKMILLLKICVEEEDFNTIDNIKEIVNSYKPKKYEMRSKINYHFIIQKDKLDQKEYLRDIAIPFSIKIEDYDSLHHYTNCIMDICFDNSRYKEAMQYYRKYQKEIDKVSRILY